MYSREKRRGEDQTEGILSSEMANSYLGKWNTALETLKHCKILEMINEIK